MPPSVVHLLRKLFISFGFISFALLLSSLTFFLMKLEFISCQLLIFATTIPFIILSSSSFFLLYKLNKNSRNINPMPQNQVNVSTLLSIKMVIVVSAYYFLTTTPVNIFNRLSLYFSNKNEIFNIYCEPIYNILLVIIISNHSIKFYLYTFFVSHLKKEFLNICRKLISKIKEVFTFSKAIC